MSDRGIAIVMGDIIRSREHDSMRELHAVFNEAVRQFNAEFADRILSPMTVTLGDEFQGLVESLPDAFEIAHRMRLYLLARDVNCRFVVGAGRLQTPLNREKAWNMMGQGLSEARDLLNDKKRTGCYRFALPAQPISGELLNTIGMTMTEIEMDWTKQQKTFVTAYYLERKATNRELIKLLNTSDRNYYKVVKAANLKLYRQQRDGIAKALAMLVEKG